MKTLVVYYSKTGNTKKAAEAIIAEKQCDFDELHYDEKTKALTVSRSPADYEYVILLSPVWAFSLAEPMKLYLEKHGSNIKKYSLVVTCGGFGLSGSVGSCRSITGKSPEKAMKIRSKKIKQGDFDISFISK